MTSYRTLCAPVNVQVEVTEQCNLSCLHCYNHWRLPDEHGEAMTEALMKRVVSELIASQVCRVTMTGGEPLMNPDVLMYGLALLRQHDVDCGMNSNLGLMTLTQATELKALGVRSVLTSLLSDEPHQHDRLAGREGAFSRTMRGIGICVDAGIRVGVNMVVMQDNFARVYDVGKLAVRLGASFFAATKVAPALNCRDFRDSLLTVDQVRSTLSTLEQIHSEFGIGVDILECYPLCLISDGQRFQHFARRSCSAGVTGCTISARGDIRPCSRSDMLYGNLMQSSLVEIWGRMHDWRDGSYLPSLCRSCRWLGKCSGGCRMEAKYHGAITDMDPLASNPKEVLTGPLSPLDKGRVAVPMGTLLRLNTGCRLRVESFGATIFVPHAGARFVDEVAARVLLRIEQSPGISVDEIRCGDMPQVSDGLIDSEDGMADFLSELLSQKYLTVF